jgi:hypothetical protein
MAETEIRESRARIKKPTSRPARTGYPMGLSLPGLTSGLVSVDPLAGGLKRGAVALLTGSDIRLRAAGRCCVRAQLPEALDGMFNRARTFRSASSSAVRPVRFQGTFMAIAFDHGRRLEDLCVGLEKVRRGMQCVG